MFDLQTVLTYLTLISIPVGVAYHIMTLNNTRKNQQMQLETRQAQLFMGIYQHYFDPVWLKPQTEINIDFEDYNTVDEFFEKYGPWKNREKYLVWLSRANFYEGIGILVKRDLIDVTMVDDLISGPIMLFWEKRAAPIIDELRERYNNPAALEWVEYLYNEVKRVRDTEHPEYIGSVPMGKNNNR
jgi:hypothetical protein